MHCFLQKIYIMSNYHLVHRDGEWKLEAQGANRATKSFGECTKKEAVRLSAEFLHGSHDASLRIHGLDGRIQEERSYHQNGRSNVSAPRKSNGNSHKSGGPRGSKH
jgi:hypothetical protein